MRDLYDGGLRPQAAQLTMSDGLDAPTRRLALKRGEYFAEIWPELGGAIASFEWRSRNGALSRVKPLFRSTRVQHSYLPTDLACFPLLPHSNRFVRPWEVLEGRTDRCTLRLVHGGDADWPFAFTAVQGISLTDAGLELRMHLTNNGPEPMPYGLGQQPYVRRPPGTRIFAKVAGMWISDAEQLPRRVSLPVHWDLPHGCVLDSRYFDHCFDGLHGDVRVAWPDGSGLRVSSVPGLPFLVLYSTPQCDFVCIESVSQRPDAFAGLVAGQRAAGTELLEPLESTTLVQRFEYLPGADTAH